MVPVLLRNAAMSTAARRLLSSPPKMISRFVLFYDYTPDARRRRPFLRRFDGVDGARRRAAVEATSSAQVLEKRDPYRAGHLGLIKEMAAEGRVLSAGAFTDPVDGAMFVFTDREAADEFKAKDPYGPHVVAGSPVREWTTVDLP